MHGKHNTLLPLSQEEARKEMQTMAIVNFDIPGEQKFPLNALYGKPQDNNEADQCRAYIMQLRQELGQRIIEKVNPLIL